MSPNRSSSVEFIFIAEAGVLERQALLLAESIRKFGGRYAQTRLTALQPRISHRVSDEGRRLFSSLDVKLVELSIVSPCPHYGTSYRILACAEYERVTNSERLVFLDSDTVVLAEPDFELEAADVAARPVDVKGMCTTGNDDANDAYWRALCTLCEVDCEQLPFVTSTVDQARVRASYNGGLTVVKARSGLFGKTADFFLRSLRMTLAPWPDRTQAFSAGHGEVPPEGGRLWGSAQACLSLAVTSLGLSVRILPPSVNFPLNFYTELKSGVLSGRPPVITHLHYHHLFRDPSAPNLLLENLPGFPVDAMRWLRTRPGANPNLGKRLVLVLGMHRSGTSTLTKGLETLGIELVGDMMPANEANPRGYWEDLGFCRFNQELLGALGRDWQDIASLDTDKVAGLVGGPWFRRAVDLLHTRFAEKTLIGLKDPRFCLLLPFWNKVFEAAGIVVSPVVIVRNPRSVAASLRQRNAFSESQGLWLWWLYNARLAATMPRAPALVIDYDLLIDAPGSQLTRLAAALELPVGAERLIAFETGFLDASLRHTFYPEGDSEPAGDTHPAFAAYSTLKSLANQAGAPSPDLWAALPEKWRRSLGHGQFLLEMAAALLAEKRLLQQNESVRQLEFAVLKEQQARLETRLRRIQSSPAWKLYAFFQSLPELLLSQARSVMPAYVETTASRSNPPCI